MTDFATLYRLTKEMRVLLAEDEASTREEMHRLLEELFAEVVSVGNGADALRLYEEARERNGFDLVITDLQMPCMHGVSLVRAVKELAPRQHILVLSGHTDSEYLLELINTGIFRFITKPLDHDTFFRALQDACTAIADAGEKGVPEEEPVQRLGKHLVWDRKKRLLKRDGEPVELTRNELLFLEALLANAELVTSTQSLMEMFFREGTDITESGIRNLVLRLRKKLPRGFIGTVYGMGYKLRF